MTVLLLAIVQEAYILVDTILEKTRDKNVLLKQRDIHGNNALHLAALRGNGKFITKLLNYGFSSHVSNNVRRCSNR